MKTNQFLTGLVAGFLVVGAAQAQVAGGLNPLVSMMPSSPGGYTYMIRGGIVRGAQQCGFEVLRGDDSRLPSSVLSRNVEEVLARVSDKGKVEVHVLIDTVVDNNHGNATDGAVSTYLLKRNGGRIMQLEVNSEFEDLTVQSDTGRLAYTASSRKNHQVETVWRVKSPGGGMKRVEETDFSQFLQVKAVATYVDRICKNKYKM